MAARHVVAVRNVPEALEPRALERVFAHFGAARVAKKRNVVFVYFAEEAEADRARSQLHRVRLLDKVISVEKVPLQLSPSESEKEKISEISENPKISLHPNLQEQGVPISVPPIIPHFNIPSNLNVPRGHSTPIPTNDVRAKEVPIAPTLGLDRPFPPHLEYMYPPPDGNILTNIVNTLIAVPRFYTQVLHLMNKMSLPAPFCPALPTPPLPPPVAPPPEETRQTVPPPPAEEASTSTESEMHDSDTEGGNGPSRSSRKRRRAEEEREAPSVGAMEAAGVKAEKIGALGEQHIVRKKQQIIPIKIGISNKAKKKGAAAAHIDRKGEEVGREEGKGTERVRESESERGRERKREREGAGEEAESGDMRERRGQEESGGEREEGEEGERMTKEQLRAGKLLPRELVTIPAFKNYSPGAPTAVLYVKNLAKTVAAEDLYHTFAAFFSSMASARASLGVKLMQEGRMKGQAFVTFPSVELAEEALEAAHAFVLKGKPLVVQFGRKPPSG